MLNEPMLRPAFRQTALSLLLMIGLGCATSPKTSPKTAEEKPEDTASLADAKPLDSPALTAEIQAADAEIEPEPHSQVPLELNSLVQKWIDYFSIKDRERFQDFLNRGAYYKPVVQRMLGEHGVPKDLYYLAMIESGYVTHARSRQRAVGAWQFIRATSRRYGLKTDSDVDERRDIVRSTMAAARFLKDLHDQFDSWYLALASYNAGEGRIRRAIRRGKTRDFWILARSRVLPRETLNYVPKFIAAVIIGRNPGKYGFKLEPQGTFPEVEKVKIPARVHLRELSSLAELPYDEMRSLNPHLLRSQVPNHKNGYEVWIPKSKADEVTRGVATLASLPEKRESDVHAIRIPARIKIVKVHRVRRGETLISIAHRYRTDVSDLKRINGLRSDRIYRGQRLRLSERL